jgi:hypothetical protein
MDYGNTLTQILGNLGGLLPWLGLVAVVGLSVAGVAAVILKFLAIRRLWKQPSVCLELTPPASADRLASATENLFVALHGLRDSRTLLERLLGWSPVFSLEVVSTKDRGIRYLLRIAEADAASFERVIASYLPDVRFARVPDYLGSTIGKTVRVLEAKQSGYYAYPLRAQGILEEHDPMAYLAGAMTKLSDGELMAAQIVIEPVKLRSAATIAARMMNNEEIVYQLGARRFPGGKVIDLLNSALFGLTESVGEISHGPGKPAKPDQTTAQKQQSDMKLKPARTLSQIEQELSGAVHAKISAPLYKANLRVIIATDNKEEIRHRARGIRDWLALFSVAGFQSLTLRRRLFGATTDRYRQWLFTNRLPNLRRRLVLSSAELADLYHFPHNQTARVENVARSHSKTLPAPVSLKSGAKLDVTLGVNHHHGTDTIIGLTAAERERHVYVIGGTGNGKTTMLQYAIVQDIQNGKGLAVVDPHGDLAETLVRYIPEERVKDVIYFNPDDLGYPIGLNILELNPELTGADLLREKDFLTESVISMFRKIFSDDDTGGHRIEYVLRNAIHTALTVEGATLFTVYNLLNDPKYCKKIIKTLKDPDLVSFWKNEFGKAGGFQQVKMVAGITAKIGRFLFSASAKRILEQPKSTINFDDILDGKILICNLSKGLLGEDTSELFGIAILAKIQLAALRRARTKQTERRPFYLYVDEFQNFATPSFVQMLSEARKYKLFLTMAEQSTSQQEDLRTVNIILANVGTVICFRSGNPADERMVLPLFMPYVTEGEVANLPSYNFFMRVAAITAQEPFSGETLLLEDGGNEVVSERVTERSRRNYGVVHTEITRKTINNKAELDVRLRDSPKTTVTQKLPGSD